LTTAKDRDILWINDILSMPDTKLSGGASKTGGQISLSKQTETVYKLLNKKAISLSDSELLLTKDYTSVAKEIGIQSLDSKKEILRVGRAIKEAEGSTEAPQNLVIFIRDQVKPEDLWLPRDWAKENLPTRQWLIDNGLSFENSFTNTAMCSSARATFFTGKYPAQHELELLLSDIENPILDSEVQLNPDLPTLGTVLGDLGYDVSFFGKTHLSKTFTTVDGEVVYQDMTEYDFQDWQGPDAGQDMDPKNAGGGYADNDSRFISEATSWLNNRLDSGNTKPFAMVVSLVNPHDVLAYPLTWGEGDPDTYFGYSADMIKGDIDILPPTVNEPITGSMTADGYDFSGNYKPQIQREWLRAQVGAQPLPTDQLKLNYLNFYGNLMKIADSQMGEVINTLAKQGEVNSTMFVSTADHGEMGMSHGGMVQKMFNAYEESIRVPMIWSNPRYFKGGQKSDALVSLIDFLPTVANLYGATEDSIASYDLRGVDYSPIIRRASKESKLNHEKLDVQSSILYTYDDVYGGQDPRASIPQGSWDHGILPGPNRVQAIRTKDYKYARYYSGDKSYEAKNWQGEFYDLRPNGGDYYPNIDPITGQLNPFKAAPLELRNLDPKAEALRVLRGDQPIATRQQKKAYVEMSKLLDQMIDEKLQPLLPPSSKAPSLYRYQGGSSESSAYNMGDPIVRLIPTSNGTQDLEVAFNTRAGQTYNIVSIDQQIANGSVTITENSTLVPNIVGTNGPTYQYIRGLPSNLNLTDFAVEWIGGYVPMESLA
jgi:choline-sulfatase